jgi:iron complex outermembrane recepter protein
MAMPVVHPKRPEFRLVRTPISSAVLLALASPMAMAQEDTTALGEVFVTAQKREQNLQDVPISIQTLDTKAMDELQVQSFKDYAQLLPSVNSAPVNALGSGSGGSAVYMRGVATGGDGQATTSQPSVGMYLDEQPITTIQGNLDIHMYDIARVEALAGPQGTLYGASSQAGTVRIITNKPDPSGFAASYSLEGNVVDEDDTGYVLEGFVNFPIGDNAAIRLVGWSRKDAGWIDNVAGSRNYPGNEDHDPTSDTFCGPAGSASCAADDVIVNNADLAEDNYNTVDVVGGRAALRVNLSENWTITPQVMGQRADSEGSWGDDLSSFVPGKDNVTHFRTEWTIDEWYQAGLTVEGTVGNFDLVYSGNYLERDFDGSFDYSDYSYWYDALATTGWYGSYFIDDNGDRVPQQGHSFINNDRYTKTSHELRITTPRENRVRGLLGFFYQKQFHDFEQPFGNLPGLADDRVPNGLDPNATQQYPGVVYLNSMNRTDRDEAIFGDVSFDITDRLEMSVGARYFEPEVHVDGFFGFGLYFNNQGYTDGEGQCGTDQQDYRDAPCHNVDKAISESDWVGRVNLTWKATDDALVYFTWSEGYRPGGVQRRPTLGEYTSDFLTNWEAGWKTQFADNRLQFNGAVFLEQWDDIQISFQGENGITQVDNGPSAEILGTELQLDWLVSDNFRLGVGAAYYDSELKDPYANFDAAGNITDILAPVGTSLPLTPDFKGNIIGRYEFGMGSFDAHLQGAFVYSGSKSSELNVTNNAYTGDVPSSSYFDLSTGIRKESYAIELYVKNAFNEDSPLHFDSQCTAEKCTQFQPYGIRFQPRTIGLKFSQDF